MYQPEQVTKHLLRILSWNESIRKWEVVFGMNNIYCRWEKIFSEKNK